MPQMGTIELWVRTEYLEALDGLDNFCSVDDFVATGNGLVLHPGRLYPHSVDNGHRNGVDPRHPGTKSGIAEH